MPLIIRLFLRAVLEVLLANRFVIVALFGLKTLIAGISVFLSAKLAGIHLGPAQIGLIGIAFSVISAVLVTRAALKRMRGYPRARKKEGVS